MAPVSAPLVSAITGERYTALARLSQLIAPPYDVIDAAQRTTLATRDAHNIVHVMLPEANGDRYAAAAKMLADWRREGVIARDPEPAVYVLRQEFHSPDGARHARTGVFVALAAEPYASRRVRPHERTHAGPKADRLALLEATATMVESIFVLAPDPAGELQSLLQDASRTAPAARAELDGVAISMWRVIGAAAERIAAAAGKNPVYIADGHHRFETAGAYRERNPRADRTLALVVSLADPGLIVLATHRLIRGGRLEESAALRQLEPRFLVEKVEAELDPLPLLRQRGRDATTAFLAFPAGHVYSLVLRKNADMGGIGSGVAAGLDIARIDALLVNPLAALAGKEARVDYTADPAVLFRDVGTGSAVAGVLVNPTRVTDVLAVADAGEFMPPKSTYFIPKVPSGLVLLPHDRG